MVVIAHHQPAREYSDAAFEDAHIYVHLKARYILALQQGGSKGDDRRVGAAQKFFHSNDVIRGTRPCRALGCGKYEY